MLMRAINTYLRVYRPPSVENEECKLRKALLGARVGVRLTD